jgi:hypothetical protein
LRLVRHRTLPSGSGYFLLVISQPKHFFTYENELVCQKF